MAVRLGHPIQDVARPVSWGRWDELVERVGDERFVLIGEASHGTQEFYAARAEVSRKLIEERGFHGVVAEADWPDAYRVTRYVRGEGKDDKSAEEALGGFRRFPQWMWRNTVMVEFVEWLKAHNRRNREFVGFYGMDLYSMHRSAAAVLGYLKKVDPAAHARARSRYGCFDRFGADPQAYGYAVTAAEAESCEEDAVRQLVELQMHAADYARRDGRVAEDEYFFAEQNARLVINAEKYYRSMFAGRVSSWNLRDQHMVETLDALSEHLSKRVGRAKLIVWAHNSHLGDARATEMGRSGEWNVGQLARERHPGEVINIGFTTHTGTVTAASEWDGPGETKRVRPSMEGSYERLFHESGLGDFWFDVRDADMHGTLLERAIGAIYRPETERWSHYFETALQEQFDVMIHLDETRALEALEWRPTEEEGEPWETYPTGE